MKGVVFQLLEDVAQREYGPEAWDQLLATAGGPSWSLSHPALLTGSRAEAAPAELDALSALRRTGRRAIPLLANLYPQLFVNAQNTRSFVVILAGGVIIDPKRGLVRRAFDKGFRPVKSSFEARYRSIRVTANRISPDAFPGRLVQHMVAHIDARPGR